MMLKKTVKCWKEDKVVIDSATSDVLTESERKLKGQNEKGYNLPYIDEQYGEFEIPEDVQENMADVLAIKGYLVRADGINHIPDYQYRISISYGENDMD